MKTIKKRSEIAEEYKWDISKLFENKTKWQECYDEIIEKLKKAENFKGKICSSASNLLEFLKYNDDVDMQISKVYTYASMSYSTDTTSVENQELIGKAEDLVTQCNLAFSYVNSEMLKTDYKVIKGYIDSLDELKTYSHVLEDAYRFQGHELSEEQSEMLSLLSNTLGSPSDIYKAFAYADMKFGKIRNEEGNLEEFSESSWQTFIHSPNRNIRKKAFNLLYDTYAKYKNTIAKTFASNVECDVNMAKLSKFSSSRAQSLFSDNVSEEVYDNLIDTINKNLQIFYKYYELRKKVMGLKELHLYDVYAPMINEKSKKYSYEEGQKLVYDILGVLGEDYQKCIKQAYDERWIDVYPSLGKRNGGYSTGGYGTLPYILLNYTEDFDSVSTLAHELGHSIHTLKSCQNNDYPNHSYKIFVAEVASTVNELLLRNELLNKTNDKREKLSIINSILEEFRATICRQTMFAEFERDMHKAKQDGIVLTNEYISDNYYKLNQKYFGPSVVVDDKIRYEWMRIPHFYTSFYVYKYAIGLSCACYIVNSIKNEGKAAVDKYKKFLSTGGSMYPVEELQVAGVDVTSPQVIESALGLFEYYLDMFEKIYNELEGEK